MITVSSLTKSYNEKPVFENLSFTLNEGCVTAFTGASGIGKTTLLRVICGLEKPDSGTVTGLEELRGSYVFQENRLIESKSLLRNILCVAPDKENALRLLQRADLEKEAQKRVSLLSGGMKRRAAIVRCLAAGGDFFYLDEPLRELDEKTETLMLELLKEELKNKTVFFISHEKRQTDFLADKVLMFSGSPMQISINDR